MQIHVINQTCILQKNTNRGMKQVKRYMREMNFPFIWAIFLKKK